LVLHLLELCVEVLGPVTFLYKLFCNFFDRSEISISFEVFYFCLVIVKKGESYKHFLQILKPSANERVQKSLKSN
jgi:hypothetical protein